MIIGAEIEPIIVRSSAPGKCNELEMHFEINILNSTLSLPHMFCTILKTDCYNNPNTKATHHCQCWKIAGVAASSTSVTHSNLEEHEDSLGCAANEQRFPLILLAYKGNDYLQLTWA